MLGYQILLALLLISTVLILFIAIVILNMKNKQQIHYAFLSTIIFILIWSACRLIQLCIKDNQYYVILLEHISYIGVCLVPISLLYTGIIFAKTRISFTWKHLILLAIPIISICIAFTNGFHHLFIIKYSFISTEFVYGKYYIIHELYSYFCIAVGLYFLLTFSIKNAGFFSKQAGLIFLGTVVPLLVVIISTQRIVNMPVFVENISFSFAMVCFWFAIRKYKLLNIAPVALQNVVDHISDSLVVINENHEIIDYNKPFMNTFGDIINIKRKDNLIEIVGLNEILKESADNLTQGIKKAVSEKDPVDAEKHIVSGSFDKFFKIEITPILSKGNHIGTIILLKDITELKRSIEKIQQTQKQLVERERLATLGELAGGVAHDINTPLSAIQNGLYQLSSLVKEAREGIHDGELNNDDHLEILQEMDDAISKSDGVCKKIAGIINSIRNNTRNLSGENIQLFELSNIINDLKILLGHQLKQANCQLIYNEDAVTGIKGDPGKFSQVLTNFIINAIQAYEGKPGTVEVKAQSTKSEVIISVTDHGKGIPEHIRDSIFKEILTTKGSNGTGLGMYISGSIIAGNFGGRTWIDPDTTEGTRVCIAVPKGTIK